MNIPNRIRDSRSLLGRGVRGGAWLMAGSTAEQGLRFVRNMILARLLAPESFGLMAIVISVCSLFQVLTGLGIKESIIQSPRGAERTYLNGAWWLAMARGIVIYLVALFAAPWIAQFYDASGLASLLNVAFISVLAQAAMSARAFVAVKQMRYPKWVMIQQGGSLIGIATTLILAYWLKGVWALVIGYTTEGVMRCLISYLLCPFKPGLRFEKNDLRTLLRFSSGMFGLPILMLIYTEGAIFAVGKLCTKEQLGIFAMALTLARIPSMFGNQLVDLLMPAFSEIQREPRRVNQGILKITTLAVLSGLPAAFLIAVYGRQVLSVVYGQRYAEGAMALSFLFVNELMLFCSVPMAAVYMAMGQPSLLRRFSLIRTVVIVILTWPLITYWNIAGAAVVPLTGMVAAYGFQLARLRKVTSLNVRDYVHVWLRGLLASLPWAVFWVFTGSFFRTMQPAFGLVGVGIATALIALVVTAAAYRITPLREYFWPFARQTG